MSTDPTLSVLVMLLSRNVFHVVSALQSIVCLKTFFWLIRSLVDPTFAAFIVCGPLHFLVSKNFDLSSEARTSTSLSSRLNGSEGNETSSVLLH